MAGFKIPGSMKITGVGESVTSRIIRSTNARLFPSSATKVRPGEALNDLIGINASTPQRYASPPWRGPQGVPPWKAPKSADPRAGVKARALQEEAIAKAQVKVKKKKETSAAIAKRRAIKNKSLDKTLKTEQPGNDAWLDAVVKRYPNM
jgi:hypothetical protein